MREQYNCELDSSLFVPLTSGPCDDRSWKECRGHEKFTSQTCAALWKEIITSIILLQQDMDERMNISMCNNLHYAKAMYLYSIYRYCRRSGLHP